MIDLPLFPLDTVLFPGQPLSLHIFEERYKEMIGLCIEKQQPFGVVLLESGTAEAHRLIRTQAPKPHLVGCTAHVTQVQRLAEGRLNISVIGRERFKIHEFAYDKPYLTAQVEMTPLDISDNSGLVTIAPRLRMWMGRYLKILEQAGQVQVGNHELPDDPVTLAYLGCVLLHGISMEQKQALLTAENIVALSKSLVRTYRREALILEVLSSPPEQTGPFSLN